MSPMGTEPIELRFDRVLRYNMGPHDQGTPLGKPGSTPVRT